MIQGTEARIHGIGNHKPADSLGSLQLDPASPNRSGERSFTLGLYMPPELPGHRVELLSWSRVSRARARFLWYLVLPFTLANTSEMMLAQKDGNRLGVARIAARAAGLIMTLSLLLWVFVAAETVVKRMPWQSSELTAQIIFVVLGVSLVLVIATRMSGRRPLRRASKQPPRMDQPVIRTATGIRMAWTHAGAVALFTLLIVLWRPAQMAAPGFLPSSCTPAVDCGIRDVLDLPVAWIIGSTIACFVLAAIAWMFDRSPTVRSDSPRTAGGVGAATVLTTAIVVIHTVGALFVQGVDYLLFYPLRYPVYQQLGGDHELVCRDSSPAVSLASLSDCKRTLLVYDEKRIPIYLLNLVPVAVLLLISAAALIIALFVLGRWLLRRVGWIATPAHAASARSSHSLVLRAPRLLSWLVIGMWILVPGISALTYLTVFAPTKLSTQNATHDWGYAAIVSLGHLGALITVLFFAFGWTSPAVRNVFGMIADVLGFWPVEAHPLGGRDYRLDVVSGLHSFLDAHAEDKVVLVGHSQGSVIAAWVAHERPPDDRSRLALVTCGCPLSSLYRTFFPGTFNDAFFRRARESVYSWDNLWRDTDPIGTALPNPAGSGRQSLGTAGSDSNLTIENTRIEDNEDTPRGHSDYWIEENQAVAVTVALTELRQSTR